jgi:hypothetical protein
LLSKLLYCYNSQISANIEWKNIMDRQQRVALLKAFKSHLQQVYVAHRASVIAERHRFLHQDDVGGYSQRVLRARMFETKSVAHFNSKARSIVSSKVRVVWDTPKCCTLFHNVRGQAEPDILVLGTPSSAEGIAASMLRQQEKERRLAPLKAKRLELERRIIACGDDIQQRMLRYQEQSIEIQRLRSTMTRSHKARGGLAALSEADLAIVEQAREIAEQMHIDKIYIPRKRKMLARLKVKLNNVVLAMGL